MHYVGIDLGTTNSAICTFDGENVRLYKSPEQHDVTPSAIYIDKRGNKYVGRRAYDLAAKNPDNSAVLFKRLMGTSTPIQLAGVGQTFTPEECSAEVLRILFSYLPEEIRNTELTGTVITVPAAFNQMQKEATLAAAEAAGIGRVALMQEPVAAVMSVMRQRKNDGIFLVYDLGGGTLDIAIAESISGRVSLLAHGGIAMCGGRDFDRTLFDNVVKPWLLENFDLPEGISTDAKYRTLRNVTTLAAERAKIELSQKDSAIISMPETDLGMKDNAGNDIYVDIELKRSDFDKLIEEKLLDSIKAARETLEKAGLTSHDIEKVVFVGGPTNYKPLRDKVSFELGIAPSTDVNPMTAVAEGAAIFAESIDWSTQNKSRKTSRGTISTGGALDLSLNYISRTPDHRTRVVAKIVGQIATGAELQIDSLDTGWTSGRIALKDGATVDLVLSKPGENTFKIFVFDGSGGPIKLPSDKITITRTAASIDAIPASHSVGVEVREKLGSKSTLDYLVSEGDQLPKVGKKFYKAAESLKAGSSSSLKFKLWEGTLDPVTDNAFVGMFEIKGSDFTDGVIAAGAELIVDYEINDSGNIKLKVSVPSIGGLFESSRNFYSRQEAQINFSNAAKLVKEQAERSLERLDAISSKVEDERLAIAKDKLNSAGALDPDESDPEKTKLSMDAVQEAKRLISSARQDHINIIRQLEFDVVKNFFDEHVREHARPSEESAFDNLARTAERAMSKKTSEFETLLEDMRSKNWLILWRQDWFVVNRFKHLSNAPYLFPDQAQYLLLKQAGDAAISGNDIEKLREILYQLDSIRTHTGDDDDMFASSNIVAN